MSSINKVTLIGNLASAPETKTFMDGSSLTNITIMTNEKWTDKATGEKKEASQGHRVVLRGNVAEIAQKYLQTGSQVYIEGKLVNRSFTNKDNIVQYVTEIVVAGYQGTLQMLGKAPTKA